jgi:hypothetical protein
MNPTSLELMNSCVRQLSAAFSRSSVFTDIPPGSVGAMKYLPSAIAPGAVAARMSAVTTLLLRWLRKVARQFWRAEKAAAVA